MSTVYADTVEPSVPTKDTTLGATGDSITIGANSINTNVIQDSGGNVLFQSDGSGTLSNVNSAFSADLKLLSSQTASGASSIDFTSGIDSTYDVYIFKFISLNPAVDRSFQVGATIDGGTDSFAVIHTTTYFDATHKEDGSGTPALTYQASYDQAQQTTFQTIATDTGSAADEAMSGEMYLFNPSSTTYVTNFYTRCQNFDGNLDSSIDSYVGGYYNVTNAINGLRFQFPSTTFDGTIKMYGL